MHGEDERGATKHDRSLATARRQASCTLTLMRSLLRSDYRCTDCREVVPGCPRCNEGYADTTKRKVVVVWFEAGGFGGATKIQRAGLRS